MASLCHAGPCVCERIGRRAIWHVAAGDRSLDDYDEDEDFKEADETLHCDLVLYVKGHEASEILQSSEDRFTDAWPKLMREFGAETRDIGPPHGDRSPTRDLEYG